MGGVEWLLHIGHVSGLALLFPRCVNVTKRDCALHHQLVKMRHRMLEGGF